MLTKSKSKPHSILIFEFDNAADKSLNIALPGLQYSFKRTASTEEFTGLVKSVDFALVILNSISDFNLARKLVHTIKTECSETGIILISAHSEHPAESALTELGVTDCLIEPVPANLLINKIKLTCESFNDKRELLTLRQQVAMSYAFDNLIGVSAEIQKIKRTIQNVVNNDFPIVLSGEDGTGKNLLAKIIHYHSTRRQATFAQMDCSALHNSQIETELFGTGQSPLTSSPNGPLFQRGADGTIFIDKLHLLDSKMLSRLQNLLLKNSSNIGSIRLGDKDFRLFISVNSPLYDLYADNILERKFIDGINAVEIHLPPLRDRMGDIEMLAAHLLRMIAFESDSQPLSITSGAVEMLKSHDWPGNIRELENCLRRAAALCNDRTIDIADVSFISAGIEYNRLNSLMKSKFDRARSLSDSQRHLISEALAANEWNFSQTAKQLGIGRTTLWRKVRKFNLKQNSDETLMPEPAEKNR
jgi:DNA-binding NtrC family response regulator